MEIGVNFGPIVVGALLSVGVGALWYGPLFGNKWLEVIGIKKTDADAIDHIHHDWVPLYGFKFMLTLFQVMILAFLVQDTKMFIPFEKTMWIWVAFVVPTIASSVIWNNKPTELKRAQFFIQAGYQLLMYVIYGALLQFWP